MTKHRERGLASRILFAALVLILFARGLAPSAGGSAIQERMESNKELASILSVVQVERNPELTMEPTVGRGGLLTSRDKRYYAYIFCVPVGSKEDVERCAHRVHFEENTRGARLYQIRGEPELEEVTRTIDNLKWVNNYTLSYERWAGPHFGHRYLIDVRSKKQVTAYDVTHGLSRINPRNPAVTLIDARRKELVQCFGFAANQKDAVSRLGPGQRVSMKGKCMGRSSWQSRCLRTASFSEALGVRAAQEAAPAG